jgi:hypothetical protein
MKTKADRVICYVNDCFTFCKVNDLDNRSFLVVNRNDLIKILGPNYYNLNDEQLLIKIKNIINSNNKYSEFRKVKSIEFI